MASKDAVHARYLFESVEESTNKYRGTYSMLVILRVCAGVRRVTLHDATLTISNDQSPYFHSSPLPLPVAVPGACRLARIPAMGAQARCDGRSDVNHWMKSTRASETITQKHSDAYRSSWGVTITTRLALKQSLSTTSIANLHNCL
ncbi:hypothetical protein T02_14925 [Trichinella nativa]|uniref:Uncharacterized protein n=1 Tax=Trichinella nativa TaxID=6335 RepID=A0A0V1L7V2_9BILA|nr:hypothetical protein T02_14925 [Trichinella nativa]